MSKRPPEEFWGSSWPVRRTCGYVLSGFRTSEEEICTEPAVIHAAWRETDPLEEQWACSYHAGDLRAMKPFRLHSIGPCCGLPNALFYVDDNFCAYPDDDVPVAEKVEQALHQRAPSGIKAILAAHR